MGVSLGDRVKCKITGVVGIAIGETNWLYGCRRITIQPEEHKDGKPAECFTFDEPQLEVLKPKEVEASPVGTKHGVRENVERGHSVTR